MTAAAGRPEVSRSRTGRGRNSKSQRPICPPPRLAIEATSAPWPRSAAAERSRPSAAAADARRTVCDGWPPSRGIRLLPGRPPAREPLPGRRASATPLRLADDPIRSPDRRRFRSRRRPMARFSQRDRHRAARAVHRVLRPLRPTRSAAAAHHRIRPRARDARALPPAEQSAAARPRAGALLRHLQPPDDRRFFYRAWADATSRPSASNAASPTTHLPDGGLQDRFATYSPVWSGSACGSAEPRLLPRPCPAGLLRPLQQPRQEPRRPRRDRRGFFRRESVLNEFVGRWIDLPSRSVLQIGTSRKPAGWARPRSSAQDLGLPDRIPARLGPMDFEQYQRLLARQPYAEAAGRGGAELLGDDSRATLQLVLQAGRGARQRSSARSDGSATRRRGLEADRGGSGAGTAADGGVELSPGHHVGHPDPQGRGF